MTVIAIRLMKDNSSGRTDTLDSGAKFFVYQVDDTAHSCPQHLPHADLLTCDTCTNPVK